MCSSSVLRRRDNSTAPFEPRSHESTVLPLIMREIMRGLATKTVGADMREFHRDVILRNAEGRQHAGGGERGTRFIAWRGAPRISREMCLEQEKGEQLARRTFSTLVLFKSPVQTLLLSHFWPTSSSSLGPIDSTKCWRTFLCGQACEASNACAYSRDQVRSDP